MGRALAQLTLTTNAEQSSLPRYDSRACTVTATHTALTCKSVVSQTLLAFLAPVRRTCDGSAELQIPGGLAIGDVDGHQRT